MRVWPGKGGVYFLGGVPPITLDKEGVSELDHALAEIMDERDAKLYRFMNKRACGT